MLKEYSFIKMNIGGNLSIGGNLFDISLHYDSSLSDKLPIRFPNRRNWIGVVTYINFKKENNVAYEDMTAYLNIKMSDMLTSTCITQIGRKPEGIMIPISHPDGKQSIHIPIRGASHSNDDDMYFSILDKNFKKVECRLVVTMRIFSDEGKIKVKY